MKTLIIGDVHGYDTWKSLIEKESPDKVIFLGDYFDSFALSGDVQADNFKEIIKYKEKHKDSTILLLGNHDYHYLMIGVNYSGYKPTTKFLAQPLLEDAVDRGLMEIIHVKDGVIYSHAGVSEYWLKNVSGVNKLEDIVFGKLNLDTLDWNGIKGFNPYGDTISNSPIWIRPYSLSKDMLKGYDQVVGHTTHKEVMTTYRLTGEEGRNDKFYVCDCLPYEYLVIEDENFIIKKC